MDLFHNLTVTDEDFHRMVHFIQDNYGIDLSQKKQLIVSRLSHTLKSQGYTSFKDFLDRLISKQDPEDIHLVLDKLTTNYTYFMREPEHFTFLRQTVLPELAARHQRDHMLAIWSAGCSSGEEPYTLSMVLKDFFGPQFSAWDTRILATDISSQVLAKAKEARYERPSDVPEEWLRRYFRRDAASGKYTPAPDILQNVIFRPFNLMDPIRFKLKFDLIFCRNVMIYFNQKTRNALVRRFYDAMLPGAYLFISHSESLGQTPLFRTAAPSVYQRIP